MPAKSQQFQYDYLIIGAGLYAAVCAREMLEAGKKVLVLERRQHIAGNCYSENIKGIDVHKYGAHILHTKSRFIWDYILKFTKIHDYRHLVKSSLADQLYSFPINLKTFEELYGLVSEEQVKEHLAKVKIPFANPKNLQEWALSQVGEDLYEKFIKGYTQKQWNCHPQELDTSIIQRIPVRQTLSEEYFDDPFQGIPSDGYTKMMENMLAGIEVRMGVDFLKSKDQWSSIGRTIIYTGKIDEYFDYVLGELKWRSLNFVESHIDREFYQDYAVINYPEKDIPFTRIIEHKHFNKQKKYSYSYITQEYAMDWSREKEAYYPVYDSSGKSQLYLKYREHAKQNAPQVYFKGRLGEYLYRDMCPTIAAALSFSKKQLKIKR